MIVGRGTVLEEGRRFVVTLEFPFINPELEGYDQFAGFVTSIVSMSFPLVKALLGHRQPVRSFWGNPNLWRSVKEVPY